MRIPFILNSITTSPLDPSHLVFTGSLWEQNSARNETFLEKFEFHRSLNSNNQTQRRDSIYQQLNFKYGLQSILADDAAIMIDEGKAILLDVRLAEDHPKSHPKGSVSCPAFRVIKTSDGFGVGRMMKGLLMMANGVTPTEVSFSFFIKFFSLKRMNT